MVAVLNSPIARSSRIALAALVVGTLVSCASSGSIRVARNAEMNAELRHRGRRIHQAAARESQQPRRAPGARARQAARVAGSFQPRTPAHLDRQARRGARRVPARRRAESRQCGDRARTAGHAHAAARQDRDSRGRQDATRIADRAEPRGAAARRRPARPTPSCPTQWSSATPAPATSTPRSASSRTSAWCSTRPSAISRCRSICAARRSTRRSTASRSRRATSGASPAPRTITVVPDTAAKRREYEEEIVRTFYLSNADLKETIDMLRIVVDARRLAADHRDQRDHDQGHARAHHRRRQDHHRDRQGAARSDHRRRAARGESHAPARVRPADRVARLSRASAAPPTSTGRPVAAQPVEPDAAPTSC